jgi:putative hydrolase of the HAD superfamily
MIGESRKISSIVFDLDGTLYISDLLAREVEEAAEILVASSRGLSREEGGSLLTRARHRLAETMDEEPTLTRTCMELGIEVPDLHRAFQKHVRPERYLTPDPVLVALLEALRDQWQLYIYTNNNLLLTRKILALLGVDRIFARLYTIEFCWLPKPDPEAFRQVVMDIGGPPEGFLFVGDRAAVDLQLAAAHGMATLLVRETADLLQVHRLLGIIP